MPHSPDGTACRVCPTDQVASPSGLTTTCHSSSTCRQVGNPINRLRRRNHRIESTGALHFTPTRRTFMSHTPQSARIAPPEIVASIAAVVDYNWDAEQADHQEQSPQDRPGHVFNALTVIRGWLDAVDDLTQLHETANTDADRHR
ncbi:hypothetical protein GCM10010428_44000 [Actinosynnema pretiosum subsp. pretiosum]